MCIRTNGGSDAEGPTVLVTAAHDKRALAVTRTLGKRGYKVIAASHRRIAQSFVSKFTSDTLVYADPKQDERTFVADLEAAILEHDVDVLLPTDHHSTISVSRFRDRLASLASVPVVEGDALQVAEDKARLLSIADDIGIPIPETHRPTTLDELDEIATAIDYPAVIKYNKSFGAVGIQYVDSPEELRRAYRPTGGSNQYIEKDWPLVQEYVPGETYDVNALFDEGTPLAMFSAHRTVTYPRSGGRSVVAESTAQPDLIDIARRLLEHLGWHGLAEVEFKLDPRDGTPKLMEINPRMWGNIDLSIQAGMDFPALLCDLALTGDVTAPASYDVGRKVIWLDGGFTLNLLHSNDRLAFLQDVLGEYTTGGTTTIELTDPVPHLLRFYQLGWRGARKVART